MMEIVRIRGRRVAILAAYSAMAAAVVALAAGMATAAARSATSGSAASTPPKTVTAALIKRRPHTLKPGTAVRSSVLEQRVFVNARNGFALANTDGAQYPAATTNGGQTWKTNGPALHLDAAQAPLVVTNIGAANKHTVFAFGGGQVVDATGDGGKHWWQANLGGVVLAAVPRLGGGLIAISQNPGTGGSGAQTLVYVSRDGGHHWHLNKKFGT
jgi:hypothetical protein